MAFVVDPSKPAAEELQRIATEELESALRSLAEPERKGIEATVHSVRKNCKRVRALVRLVRPALRSEYKRTNIAVRDASAQLSPLRDAHAVLATFDSLTAARPDLFPARGFDDVRAGLVARADAVSDPSGAGDRFAAAAALLGHAAGRVSDWRLKVDLRDVIDGAAEYHGLARRAFRHSLRDASDEHLHEWRKRSKDCWYHTQLLCPLAPSVLSAAEKSLSNLADALGDNNDLAVLSQALRDSPEELGADQAHEALRIIHGVRNELLSRCRPLGALLYAEDDDEYRARLRRYAKAHRVFGPEQRVRKISKIFEPTDRATWGRNEIK